MLLDKSNSTMARDVGLIFSLFDVVASQEVPFAIPLYMQCILHGLTNPSFVSHSSLLTTKVSICGRHVMASICNGNRL